MSSEKVSLRSNQPFLIGPVSHQITGCKLPSNRQVLSVFFYNLRTIKLDLKISAALVIKEVSVFWEKARIPMKRSDHSCEMLIKLHDEWRGLQKSANKTSESAKNNRSAFTEKLDDLFDIAHKDAEEQMRIQEDIEFLRMQRMKGRPGIMLGVDINLHRAEKRYVDRKQEEVARKTRCLEQMEQSSLVAELLPSTSSSSSTGESEGILDAVATEGTLPTTSGLRGTHDFFNDRLAAALDRCKISDRDAVHILMATAEALGHETKNLVINRNSISRKRSQFRTLRYKEMLKNFNIEENQVVVVHWDGKLLPAISGNDKVERLAIFLTFDGKEQLIGAPSINQASGLEQANAVFRSLEEWGLLDSVQAMCFDTTASNTGRINGACRNIETILEKELLYLPCRHHIFEVVLKGVFDELMGPTSGPEVPIFSRFKNKWSEIKKKKKISSGIEDNDVNKAISEVLKKELIDFFFNKLQEKQFREDYMELLELAVIFLGETPTRGISFRKPGAISHARWMAKAIYCIKIFLFRDEFRLSDKERSSLKHMCMFLIRIYLPAWYEATNAIKAPLSDLNFIKKLVNYVEINSSISNAAIKKFSNHLWYLAPETAAFGFFDERVTIETKVKMVERLHEITEEEQERENKFFLRPREASNILLKDLSDFITPASLKLFSRFNIKKDFLQTPPTTWCQNKEYFEGLNIMRKVEVVNDVAERGIQLIQEYNNVLTRNDDEKQFILQVVKDYRQQYPSSSKSTLLEKYN